MSDLLYYRTVGIISDRQTDKKEIQKSSILRFHVTPTNITQHKTQPFDLTQFAIKEEFIEIIEDGKNPKLVSHP